MTAPKNNNCKPPQPRRPNSYISSHAVSSPVRMVRQLSAGKDRPSINGEEVPTAGSSKDVVSPGSSALSKSTRTQPTSGTASTVPSHSVSGTGDVGAKPGQDRGPSTPEEGIDECLRMIIGATQHPVIPGGHPAGFLESKPTGIISAEVVLSVHRLNM